MNYTPEELLEALYEATTIIEEKCGWQNYNVAALDAISDIIKDYAERQNPQPFSLEQLREMDGMPVCVHLNKSAYQKEEIRWAILKVNDNGKIGYQHSGGVWYYSAGHPHEVYAHQPKGANEWLKL